jgi:Domain of unknown function (DUF927)/Domain of unknown function (DUF3854)
MSGWDDDDDNDSNPYGYTEEPEEPENDEPYSAAPDYPLQTASVSAPASDGIEHTRGVSVPTEATPPTEPPPIAAVVDIGSARQKRAPSTPKLPEVTGLASFRTDHPVHELDILLADLRKSELTDATIEAARLTCLHASKWRAYGFRCQPSDYASPKERAAAAGLLLPFFAPGAAEPHGYRLRPEYPVKVPITKPGQKQKFKKYDQPFGTALLVYTPPLEQCVTQLRGTTPLYWTEGEKKALLIAQLGMCVVGLTGVDAWSQPGSKSTLLHPYIAQHYGIAGREHVIVYDSDVLTNPGVLSAMRKLATVLRQLGALSVTSALPPLELDGTRKVITKGIDDYAHVHGAGAAGELLRDTRDEIAEVAPRINETTIEKVSAFAELTRGRDLVIPSPYSVDEHGAVWLHTGYEDEAKRLVTPRPIFVTRLFTDMHRNGEFRAELQFQTARGTWQAITVPRALTGSRALAPELRRAGALVDETSVSEVIKWLTAWEARNGAALEPVRCVDRAGWCEDQFALGPEHVFAPRQNTPVAFDVNYDQGRLFKALGNMAENVDAEAIAHAFALQTAAQASDDCAMAVFASLTAPLLRPFTLPNFAVHLCGDSSRGKTSMLRCAASVYGHPDNPAWVPSWNTTMTGLEQHAAQLCDLPLCFDEAGTGDPEAIQTAIYMLINGVGRQRSTKELTMRRTLSWQTVVISTGERELASESSATGAQVRVISLPITGFGELDAAGVDAIRARCSAHAGAFGVVWLRRIVDIASDPTRLIDARERLQQHRRVLQEIARASGNPLNGRIADYFAAMMLAEDLASELGLGQPGGQTVRNAFERRCSQSDDTLGSAPSTLRDRVLEALEDWPARAPSAFPQLVENAETGQAEASTASKPVVHGYVRQDGAICFLPDALKEYLAAKGLAWTKALMRDLIADGRLVRQQHGHATCLVRVNGRRTRYYVLASASDEGFTP